MELFKKYVTCTMAFFTLFIFVTLCQFYSITSPVLFNRMREKKIFANVWLLLCITLYQRRQKIISLDTIEFIDPHICINNPHWQSSGIIIFLWKYDAVISNTLVGSFLDVRFLLLAVILIIRASWKTKNERLSNRKNFTAEFVWGTCLFWLHILLSMSFFVAFFTYSLPLPKRNPSKHSSWWRPLEDVFRLRLQKTSSRRLDQDEYIRLSLTSSEDFFKTSWSRPIYSFWPYVFKTSSRRLQDVFKTSSRRLQDVFKTSSRCLQDLFKTSCKNVFKTFSRRTMRLNCLPRSHLWICVC